MFFIGAEWCPKAVFIYFPCGFRGGQGWFGQVGNVEVETVESGFVEFYEFGDGAAAEKRLVVYRAYVRISVFVVAGGFAAVHGSEGHRCWCDERFADGRRDGCP